MGSKLSKINKRQFPKQINDFESKFDNPRENVQQNTNNNFKIQIDKETNEDNFNYPYRPDDPDHYFDNLKAKKIWRDNMNKENTSDQDISNLSEDALKTINSFQITSQVYQENTTPEIGRASCRERV